MLHEPRIEIQNQILAQGVRIAGTPFSLHYGSDRVPGRRAAYTLQIPLSGARVPSGLTGIALEIHVGGRRLAERFPAAPNLRHAFTWDGLDADGRPLGGRQPARVRVGYVYAAAFPRPEMTRWQEWRRLLGTWDARALGLGGWSLDVHHAWDPAGGVLYAGDGRRRSGLGPAAGDGGRAGERWLPAEDGAELFVFDPSGRHLRTLDALTGATLVRFEYDAAGRLAAVVDIAGNATRIERDTAGAPTAIVAPFLQRTTLTLDAPGYLAGITNPAGEACRFAYADGGLLVGMTDPRGGRSVFRYDDGGYLVEHTDPAGGVTRLARGRAERGVRVVRVSAVEQESTHTVERLPSGEERRVNKCCGAGPIVAVTAPDGRETVSYPDGTTVVLEVEPDPRLGAAAPLVRKAVVKTPAGLTRATTTKRRITLADPRNPLSLASQTDTRSVSGREYTTTFEAARRQIVATTPGGRRVLTLDERGLVVGVEVPGLAPVAYRYDAHGRPTAMEWGPRRVSTSYDAQGRPSALTHADGTTYRFAYDDAGRVVQVTLPSGRLRRFAYDPSGNLTQLTMPGGAVHRLERDAVNLEVAYVAPGSERLTKSYDRDRRLTAVTLPGGRTVTLSYHDSGALAREQYAEATREFTYEPASRRLTGLSRVPAGGGPPQRLAYAWDGFLLTEIAWSGEVTGRYRYRYDNGHLLAGVTLDAGPETALGRDADGRLIAFGPFTIAREDPGGAPSGIRGGPLTLAVEHDDLGRIRASSHRVNGREVYRLELTHDAIGRITEKRETVLGSALTQAYAYDPDGQLAEVRRDGATAERYAYDADGNRTSRQVEAGPAEAARYAEDDRLLERGAIPYRFDPAGFLVERGGDAFAYSARGELFQARLADGRTVTYGYDATGRRVSRTDGSGTYRYLYGNPAKRFQVTAVRAPSGTLDVYWYDDVGRLFAIQRGQVWYYVATDHVGTPRALCDVEGRPVRVLAHDSFGNPTTDSNPDFPLAVGFAAGLADLATGLVRFGLRDYEPAAGRWTSKDPIGFDGSDPNLYGYVRNDPVNFVDPTGLQEEAAGTGAGGTPSGGTGSGGINVLGREPGTSGIDWSGPSPGGLDDPNWSPGQPSGPGEGNWKYTHGSDAPKEPGYDLWKPYSRRRRGGAGRVDICVGGGRPDSPTDPRPNPSGGGHTGADHGDPIGGPIGGVGGQGGVSVKF